MTDSKALMGLLRQYERARQDLVEAVLKSNGIGTKTYANTLLRRVDRILQRIKEKTKDYANTEIRREYEKALEDMRSYYERNNLLMDPINTAFSQIHEDAIDSLVREMQYEVEQGIAQVGRRIARHIEASVDNILRSAALEQISRKIATGATLRKLQKNLVSQLQNEGIFSVQYGSGPNAYRVSLNAYASMVARSTTREAGNVARINSATEHGYDLVLCTSHYPTCEICAPLQGRVYSISGKDKRFPALSSIPGLKDGYYTIHPNCRHVFVPTVERLWSEEERKRYLADAKKPIEGDNRSKRETDLYVQQQTKNRHERQARYQYERYKSVLGNDAPKTYSAFKRIKNADGDSWRFMQLDYRRRNALLRDNGLMLPHVEKATIDSRKFTKYLFSPESEDGWPKGMVITNRLGYNINNWTKLRDEIQRRAFLYPVVHKSTDMYGDRYEQKIVIYGLKGKPANMIVGWKVNSGKTWLASLYIKEVKEWRNLK